MLSELEAIKNQVPEFVIKLYHILEKPEYKDYITWANDDTQILIKQPKKLQDRVLPYFFRHKHLSSFIRQLNMYKFNKVNKISKERGWMYFKNDYFQRNNIKKMKLVKRTHNGKKKDKKQFSDKEIESDAHTIKEQSLMEEANSYRYEAEKKFEHIQLILQGIIRKNQSLARQINPALMICQEMTGKPSGRIDEIPSMGNIEGLNDQLEQCEKLNHNNLLGSTIREFVPMQSIIFPSVCSLSQFE